MGVHDANAGRGVAQYLQLLRRRKWPVIISVLLGIAAAVALPLLQEPMYRGRADVVLHLQNRELLFDATAAQQSTDPARVVPTEIRVVESQEVRAAAHEKLGFPPPPVSARAVAQTNVIEVTAKAETPGRALRIADAYANAYIELRRAQAVDNLLAAGQQVQAKVAELQRQIDVATGTQRDALIQAQALFKQRLDQLQVDAALKTGGAEVVRPISGAIVRVNLAPVPTLAAGLALGLAVGIGIALLREHLDESIKVKEDLERFTPGVPVLGLIPAVDGWRASDGAVVVSLRDPQSHAAEAYRTLRTVIQFLGQQSPTQVIQVTSPNAQEGKSTTIANLSLAIAGMGQRVIIVCCDLRRPRIHEFLGLDNDVGFTSVTSGQQPMTTALQEVHGQKYLRVLASGPPPDNPAELLSSGRAEQVFETLRSLADVVLVDTPPVLPVTDALVVSRLVDAIILVAAHGVTTRREMTRATELLQQVDAPLVGVVLNGVVDEPGYGYGYKYYQGSEQRDGFWAERRTRIRRSG